MKALNLTRTEDRVLTKAEKALPGTGRVVVAGRNNMAAASRLVEWGRLVIVEQDKHRMIIKLSEDYKSIYLQRLIG